MKNILLWLTATLIGILLTGCSSDSGSTMALKSSTSFTVKWDTSVRDLTAPSYINSIIVKVYQGETIIDQLISNRPTTGNTTTIAFFGLPNTSLRFTINAYSASGASGILLSTSEQTYTPNMGLNQLTINMHSIPTSIYSSPRLLTLDLNNQSLPLTISAYDGLNNLIIFNPGELEYTMLDPTIASFELTNVSLVKITPLASGTTNFRVKSTIPGVNKFIDVSITVNSLQITTPTVNPTTLGFAGGVINISATVTGGTPGKVEAEISGGTYSVPTLITLNSVRGAYSAVWTAPPNLSTNGAQHVYSIKIKATALNNSIIEIPAGSVTINPPEMPPAPI
jgi:hypothetical protein